jgi:NTE family protein
MQPVRTLTLSGGSRGAFHPGVYRYLCEIDTPGLDADHQGCRVPDIVAGTSIGAVNGVAIVQGMVFERLEEIWRDLRESDIPGLPPGMRRLSRWAFNLFLRQFIGVVLLKVPTDGSTSPPARTGQAR